MDTPNGRSLTGWALGVLLALLVGLGSMTPAAADAQDSPEGDLEFHDMYILDMCFDECTPDDEYCCVTNPE